MKKLLATSLLLTSTLSMAATTGTLFLQGSVAEVVSITVTAEATATALDLSASPADLKVATVNEQSNANTGYKILMKSTNGGTLNNGSLDSLAYQISYDGGSAVSPTTADQVVKTVATAGVYNTDSDIDISYTGKAAALMVEGSYSDTLTFTISAN